MKNFSFSFDHTMRELFEYPDPSFPFITWMGNFDAFADRSLACHWHNEFEYGVVLSGTLDYYIDGNYVRVNEGDVVFVNSNAMHMATQVGDECAVLYTVSFIPSLFTGGANTAFFKKYFQPVLQSPLKGLFIDGKTNTGAAITELLRKIYELETHESKYYEIICISLMSDIWKQTLHYIQEQPNSIEPACIDDGTEHKIKDILFYIHEHYAEDIHIEDLAKYARVSRSECFRCFKCYLNKSPIVYLTEYRLSYATKLLVDTEKTMTEIAMECGFSSASYFGKQFKKAYKASPLQFKKSHK